jgi:CDGSH iron-sulfur domain-containing protein 3
MTEAVIAARAPLTVDVEAGRTYWWCACGRSASQPFCDGSHKGTGITPVRYDASGSGRTWFCACKRSARAPLCDGTHRQL